MRWEVFRQGKPGEYHTHCGEIHAPDREMALQFARVQHGRRKPVHSMWVVPHEEVTEATDEEYAFGGTTDKSYRWATAYDIEAPAQEVADSERDQATAERRRGED